MIFGDILKELRIDSGLTQDEFAEKFNISGTAISKYETGEREPNFDLLIKLADYFNVSVDYLLGRTRISSQYNTLHILSNHSPETHKKLNYIFSKFKSRNYIELVYSLLTDIDNLK
jgi:transcriptional regulator with XRE-family HTH domain